MASPANHYAKWEGEFQYVRETSYGTDPGGGNQLLVTSEPSLDIGLSTPEDSGETGRGTPERYSDEYFTGKLEPTLSFETRADEARLTHFLQSLFQAASGGAAWVTKTNSSSYYKYIYTPWTGQPTVNL